jgi:hypothetical protein
MAKDHDTLVVLTEELLKVEAKDKAGLKKLLQKLDLD